MTTLRKAFSLLDGYSALSKENQSLAILEVRKMLKAAERRCSEARILIRDVDQLRKQLAHMLIVAGSLEEGIAEAMAVVAENESAISRLHEEAAFQLADASLHAFQKGDSSKGMAFARSALQHAGCSRTISRTLLLALELAQKEQSFSQSSHSEGKGVNSEDGKL